MEIINFSKLLLTKNVKIIISLIISFLIFVSGIFLIVASSMPYTFILPFFATLTLFFALFLSAALIPTISSLIIIFASTLTVVSITLSIFVLNFSSILIKNYNYTLIIIIIITCCSTPAFAIAMNYSLSEQLKQINKNDATLEYWKGVILCITTLLNFICLISFTFTIFSEKNSYILSINVIFLIITFVLSLFSMQNISSLVTNIAIALISVSITQSVFVITTATSTYIFVFKLAAILSFLSSVIFPLIPLIWFTLETKQNEFPQQNNWIEDDIRRIQRAIDEAN